LTTLRRRQFVLFFYGYLDENQEQNLLKNPKNRNDNWHRQNSGPETT
jgi:hypothetical protein